VGCGDELPAEDAARLAGGALLAVAAGGHRPTHAEEDADGDSGRHSITRQVTYLMIIEMNYESEWSSLGLKGDYVCNLNILYKYHETSFDMHLPLISLWLITLS